MTGDWLAGEGAGDAFGPEDVFLPPGHYFGLAVGPLGPAGTRAVACDLCRKPTHVENDVTEDGLYGLAAEHCHGSIGTGWSDPPAEPARPTPYGCGPWLRYVLASLAEFLRSVPQGTLDDVDSQAALVAALEALEAHERPGAAPGPPTDPGPTPETLGALGGPLDADYRPTVPVDPTANLFPRPVYVPGVSWQARWAAGAGVYDGSTAAAHVVLDDHRPDPAA